MGETRAGVNGARDPCNKGTMEMQHLNFVSVHEMLSLDPNTRLADSSSATPVLKIVCPNLVSLDASLNVRPELAESWEIADHSTRYTFRLRHGLTFHDGRKLDADAIVWNFHRIADSRTGSILGPDYSGLEKVEAIAADTVAFRFAEPFPAFLHHLAGRSHICGDASVQPVGAGAYRVTDWVRGSHLTFERFSGYWDAAKPKVHKIVVRWAPDSAARVALIEAGNGDLVETVPAGAASNLADKGFLKLAAVSSTKKLTLAFNCRRPPLSDRRMRQAIAHAVDRKKLVQAFLGAWGRPVDAAYPPTDAWGTEVEPIAVDLDIARKLVAEAGYGNGVKLKASLTNVAPVPRVADEVAQTLAQIGIHLDLRGYNDPPWWPLIYLDTDWDVAFQGMGPRAHPDILFRREFATGGSFNATGYNSPELDKIVSAARQAQTFAEQKRLYDQAQNILRRDLPALILYATETLVGWRPGITGFAPHPLGYWDLQNVDAA
jgi:peptide/nickel transport system substrate-binding protein